MNAPHWSLVQYASGSVPPRVGILQDGTVYEVPEALRGRTMLDVVNDWEAVAPSLRSWTSDGSDVVSYDRLLAPLTFPNKVICAGANYYGHIKEMGIVRPTGPVTPYFFFKPPTTSVVGTMDPIELPPNSQLDWEAELGVVISKRSRYLTVDEVPEVIAGYVVANDISAREVLIRDEPISAAFAYDWVSSKAQDGFCPMGPELTPVWQIDDPQDLMVTLAVNGVVKQQASTSDMISSTFEVVAEASKFMTLEPGDVILTGTCAGVGHPHGDYLQVGDDMEVRIEKVGSLSNPIVAPTASVMSS